MRTIRKTVFYIVWVVLSFTIITMTIEGFIKIQNLHIARAEQMANDGSNKFWRNFCWSYEELKNPPKLRKEFIPFVLPHYIFLDNGQLKVGSYPKNSKTVTELKFGDKSEIIEEIEWYNLSKFEKRITSFSEDDFSAGIHDITAEQWKSIKSIFPWYRGVDFILERCEEGESPTWEQEPKIFEMKGLIELGIGFRSVDKTQKLDLFEFRLEKRRLFLSNAIIREYDWGWWMTQGSEQKETPLDVTDLFEPLQFITIYRYDKQQYSIQTPKDFLVYWLLPIWGITTGLLAIIVMFPINHIKNINIYLIWPLYIVLAIFSFVFVTPIYIMDRFPDYFDD